MRRDALDDIAQIQSQRCEHLVVARSAQMNAAGARADALRQAFLKRRVPILIGKLYAPLATRMLIRQSAEAGAHGCKVRILQEVCAVQHLGVGDRRRHVIANEPRIERVVLCGRVIKHARIESCVLIPQKTHRSPRYALAVISAGDRALTSWTTSVPVPSLVNTSPRIPSPVL